MNVTLMMEKPCEETVCGKFCNYCKVLVEEGFLPVTQYSFAKKKNGRDIHENEEETAATSI